VIGRRLGNAVADAGGSDVAGDKLAPGMRLTDAQRLDWLRLIRSDNVGPRGIMAHPPQAPLNYPMPRPQVIPRDPQADAEWWLAKLRGLLGSEDGEAWLARERLAQGHQTTGRNERDS
jgi:hypothetical protein